MIDGSFISRADRAHCVYLIFDTASVTSVLAHGIVVVVVTV